MNKDVSTRIIEKMKVIRVLFPRITSQCETPESVPKSLHQYLRSFMRKVDSRLQKDSRTDQLRPILTDAAMGIKLHLADEAFPYESGLFSKDAWGVIKLVFPSEYLLQHLRKSVMSYYVLYFRSMIREPHMSFLYVHNSRVSLVTYVVCDGTYPRNTAHTYGKGEFLIPAASQYIPQTSCNDGLKCEEVKVCCLVKLSEQHFGIDFLIIFDPAGTDSKKLFLIQASVSWYSKQSGPKLAEIYQKTRWLWEQKLCEILLSKDRH